MQFEIPAHYQELRHNIRRFVEQELEPLVPAIEETGDVPEKVTRLLADNGYLGARLAEEYGGAGLDLFSYCLMLEEFSRSHRIFTLLATGTSGLAPAAILRHGTPEQRDRFVTGMIRGTVTGAFGLTEPGAGSDAGAITTRARKVDGGWVIDGRKHYISGGHKADFVVVMAVTDPEKRARGGISAFLVERGTPGFEVTRVERTIASDAIKIAELTFTDCKVPDSALLGAVGGGFSLAMETLVEGRLGVASACIGAAERMHEMSCDYAGQRHTFGKPLSSRQAIQWMIADSAVDIAAGRALTYQTILAIQSGADAGTGASMAKLYCSEMVGRVVDRAVQIHGGLGLIRGFPVERFYRDVRHYRVTEGSSEVQRMIIAREALGQGRGKRAAGARQDEKVDA